MLVENKELITVATYANDINKSQQAINRYLKKEESLPGIKEYYNLKPNIFILKKDKDYKLITGKVKKQKHIIMEK